MFEAILSFIFTYKYIILFYLVVILFIVLHRSKIDVQGKIIFLYRTKWGIAWMDKYSAKYREWVILLGYIGTGVGFIGMILISYTIVLNVYNLIFVPKATSGVSLVLPGMNIPGIGVLPFWYWLITIFIVAVVHEFSHGVVARAHNIKVKNTGVVFFGPILGAFVEPDEKKMEKEKDIVQYSVLAAGAFSNIILGLVALFLLVNVFVPVQQMMIDSNGFTFAENHNATTPFALAGIEPGTVILGIDQQQTKNFEEFKEKLEVYSPGNKVVIVTPTKNYDVVLAKKPEDPTKPFLGIVKISNEMKIKEKYDSGIGKVAYSSLEWFTGLSNNKLGFLFWLSMISVGIGLFNLLPLPIVDGGRMAQVFLHKLYGSEKGEKKYRKVSLFFLFILVVTLIYSVMTMVTPHISKLL
jgi:membrane-associated protease RseP (regulator of RpoE activity)